MTYEELKGLVQSPAWFTNLGHAVGAQGFVPITDVDLWKAVNAASISAEFGLPHDAAVFKKSPFADFQWLPTASEQPDPIHGEALLKAAGEQARESEFKAARIEIFRSALASQRGAADQPLLKIGPTDLNQPARMAGRYASRMAASEIVVDRVGFWCGVLRWYHRGHWPFAYLPSGEVLVL